MDDRDQLYVRKHERLPFRELLGLFAFKEAINICYFILASIDLGNDVIVESQLANDMIQHFATRFNIHKKSNYSLKEL